MAGKEGGTATGDERGRGARGGHLREVYRRHVQGPGAAVDMAEVRASVEQVAHATLRGWRLFAALDHIALADAGSREDFEELEFLVNRGLCELNGIKNIVMLARRLG